MIRHVVLLEFTDGTAAEEVAAIADALRVLPDRLPRLRRYTVGHDLGLSAENAHLVVMADFDDTGGYFEYRDDPVHRSILDEQIRPVLARRSAVQFEVP